MRGGSLFKAVILVIAGALWWECTTFNQNCSGAESSQGVNGAAPEHSTGKFLSYANEHCAAANDFAHARFSDSEAMLRSMLTRSSVEPAFTAEHALLVADLARVRNAQGNERDAESLLKQALSSAERDLWPAHPDCIRIRGRLIGLEVSLHEIDEAKGLLNQQIRILQALGTGPQQMWQCQRQLVEILCSSNDADSEKELNNLALAGKRTDKGAEELATLLKAAESLRDAHNWRLAERLYRRAYELRDFDYKPEWTTYYLGLCCWCQRNLKDAQKYITEAGELRRKRSGELDSTALSFSESLGRVLSESGNYSEAQRVLTNLVEGSRRAQDKKQLASACTYLGAAELKAGHFDKAEKECTTAADLFKEIGSKCAAERTVALSILAESLDKRRQFARAVSTLNQIATINPSYAASSEFKARLNVENARSLSVPQTKASSAK